MTRISSLFVATALAILPISAFAQQNAVPAKTTTPNATMSAAPVTTPTQGAIADGKSVDAKMAPTAASANMAATTTQPAKHNGKTNTSGSKTEVHGMNNAKPHDGKTGVPATGKAAEPAKS